MIGSEPPRCQIDVVRRIGPEVPIAQGGRAVADWAGADIAHYGQFAANSPKISEDLRRDSQWAVRMMARPRANLG